MRADKRKRLKHRKLIAGMTGVIRFGSPGSHLRIAKDGTMKATRKDAPDEGDGGPEVGTPELLTRRQVAALFAVSASTVTRWANKGILKTRRTPGGHYRFPTAEIRKIASAAPFGDSLVRLD